MQSHLPADVQATFCATLVDEWVRSGVRHAVIAPGSRSTPLALALVRDGRLSCHVVLDERDAGFMALGVGLSTGMPAVVLTTSGTAAVELHSSVVEANYAAVPMIAVTADRPAELHHVGAPQTIDQQALFGSSVRWFVDPGVASEGAMGAWRSLASRAVAVARGGAAAPGPVHINLAFREPLVGVPFELPEGRAHGVAWHTVVESEVVIDLGELAALFAGKRGVFIVGAGAPEPSLVHVVAQQLGWPVLAEPRSGCRTAHSTTIASADLLVRHEAFAQKVCPDVVVHVGRPWASKMLGRWHSAAPVPRIIIDPFGEWIDEHRSASVLLHAAPNAVFGALLRDPLEPAPSDWLALWSAAEAVAQKALHDELDDESSLSEPGVARTLVRDLPEGSSLVVSSSMPVRDVEWFSSPRSGVSVLSNRGANGIDGVMATAVGVAAAVSQRTYALLGDLAFLHDSNGLLAARSTGAGPLTIVVVDNQGGGIFSFLPQADSLEHHEFEKLFGTPQAVDIAAVAEAFGATVSRVASTADLVDALQRPSSDLDVIVVSTDRHANVKLHASLIAKVAEALDLL